MCHFKGFKENKLGRFTKATFIDNTSVQCHFVRKTLNYRRRKHPPHAKGHETYLQKKIYLI